MALQIWDIGGQSIFSKMIEAYVYEADCVILVYDITQQASFLDLQAWYDLVISKNAKTAQCYLIGNKVDLNHMQAVKSNAHIKFAKANSLQSFYCSAKTGDQVQTIFYKAAC